MSMMHSCHPNTFVKKHDIKKYICCSQIQHKTLLTTRYLQRKRNQFPITESAFISYNCSTACEGPHNKNSTLQSLVDHLLFTYHPSAICVIVGQVKQRI